MIAEAATGSESRERRRWRVALGTMALVVVASGRPQPLVEAVVDAPEPEPVGPSWTPPVLEAAEAGGGLDRAAGLLAAGVRAHSAGRLEEALDRFRQAREASPALSDWALLMEARVYGEQGRPEAVEGTLAALPLDLVALKGWEARVRAFQAQGRLAEAQAAVEEERPRVLDAEGAGAVDWAGSDLALAAGDSSEARQAMVRILGRGPNGPLATRAAARLEALRPVLASERLAVLEHHVARGNDKEVARALDGMKAGRGVPAGEVRGASLTVALARLRGSKEDAAAERLEALADQAPEPAIRSAAWLAAGQVRVRQGRMRDALVLLRRSALVDPRGGSAQEALFLLGDLEQDAGARAAAARRWRDAVDVDPASEWGADAATRLGVLLYHDGDAAGAAEVFDAYRIHHPEGWRFQQASFWAGLAYHRLGDEDTARLRFEAASAADPVGYYGMRSRVVGGIGTGLEGIPEGPEPTAEDATLARGGLDRVDALRRAGLTDLADLERARLHRLMGTRTGGLHTLGEEYHARGRLLDAVLAGREGRRVQGGWDVRLLRIVFPLPYRERILRSAAAGDVDPFLMASLIRRESLFQPHAVSHAGATGLMQIQPRVAAHLARRAGVRPPTAAGLKNPDVNLLLGAAFLGELLEQHGSRVEDALASYNAGSGRLARWRSFPEYDDPDAFLERIPYRETRDYIRVILETAPVYAALYGQADAGDPDPRMGP